MWRVKSWRWFTVRVRWLLAGDTPLGRFFTPDPEPEPAVDQITE